MTLYNKIIIVYRSDQNLFTFCLKNNLKPRIGTNRIIVVDCKYDNI